MTPNPSLPQVHNGEAIRLMDIPLLPMGDFRQRVLAASREGARLVAFFGFPTGGGAVRLLGVMAHGSEGVLRLCATSVRKSYPALTPDCPQAHGFEREIAEQWGIQPEGHPWLKPVRFHASYVPGEDAWNRGKPANISAGMTDFFHMDEEQIHEVAVGPVNAGIIEPGHFRFQCHGETVHHLEISLGYQHRGVERALVNGPTNRTVHYMETLAGDTTIGHTMAYCQAVEALAGCAIPARAQTIRAVALELERLANHTGDLGALANDVGFLPTASYCGRIREDFLNLTALLCGNRFGRNLLRPGGVEFDLDESRRDELIARLDQARRDATHAVELLWNTSSVRARFENTGGITPETCQDLGLVGVAARACGVERDVRQEFPFGLFRFAPIPVSTFPGGNVFSRAYVRWLEIQRSLAFIQDQLKSLIGGPRRADIKKPNGNSLVVSLIEGWRGEICHTAITDERGRLAHYKVVDPSFHNWMGLAMALRQQQISDFHLCNQSFNLSHCGHDL